MNFYGNPFICFVDNNNDKRVNLESNFDSQFGENSWNHLTSYLEDAFKIERLGNGAIRKILASDQVLLFLDQWLHKLVSTDSSDIPQLSVVVKILRSLRNCTSNSETQNFIMEKTNILYTIKDLFKSVIKIDKGHIYLKIMTQFLINLTSSNERAANKISIMFYDDLKKCLLEKLYIYENSALIYNISLTKPLKDLEIMNIIFGLHKGENQNEYLSFFLEKCVSSSEFWSLFGHFSKENKIIILQILRDMQLENRPHNLDIVGLDILVNVFLQSADNIFRINKGNETDLNVHEIALTLEILSSLASDEKYLQQLQNNKNVLITAGILLINIHKLGKVSENCFTPVKKLSEFKVDKNELNEHPAFGFKADLVRLIGNMCWKNVELQNLARSADLIPVLLECCNMDARNPFILQWSILAVRNLCKNNIENQKLIAGLNQKGTFSSTVLDEMGITLHNDGEIKLNIVPLDSIKK